MNHCDSLIFLKIAGRGDVLMRAMIKNPALREVAFNAPQSGGYTLPFSMRPDSLRMVLRYPTFDGGRNGLAERIRLFRAGKPQPPYISPTTAATAPKMPMRPSSFFDQLKVASMLRRGLSFTRNHNLFSNKVIQNAAEPAMDDLVRSHVMQSAMDPRLRGMAFTGNKAVWMNPTAKFLTRPERREVLAHEAFHAAYPKLGQSELLAHAVGGWRAPVPGSGVMPRLQSMFNSVRGYLHPEVQAHYNIEPAINTRNL